MCLKVRKILKGSEVKQQKSKIRVALPIRVRCVWASLCASSRHVQNKLRMKHNKTVTPKNNSYESEEDDRIWKSSKLAQRRLYEKEY